MLSKEQCSTAKFTCNCLQSVQRRRRWLGGCGATFSGVALTRACHWRDNTTLDTYTCGTHWPLLCLLHSISLPLKPPPTPHVTILPCFLCRPLHNPLWPITFQLKSQQPPLHLLCSNFPFDFLIYMCFFILYLFLKENWIFWFFTILKRRNS